MVGVKDEDSGIFCLAKVQDERFDEGLMFGMVEYLQLGSD